MPVGFAVMLEYGFDVNAGDGATSDHLVIVDAHRE